MTATKFDEHFILYFAGPVVTVQGSFSQKLVTLSFDTVEVPLYIDGSALQTLANDPCPVPAWLVKRISDKGAPTMQITRKISTVRLPRDLPYRLALPPTVDILVPALVPTTKFLGEDAVELTYVAAAAPKKRKHNAPVGTLATKLPSDIVNLLGGAAALSGLQAPSADPVAPPKKKVVSSPVDSPAKPLLA